MDNLLKKTISGFGWLGLINYSNRLFSFLTTLILAKLLVPEDFGLVAIASMMMEGLQLFKDMGLSEALIYRKEDIEKASNTAFTMIIILNSILFVLAIIISPIAGRFFKNNLVTPIVILMASNLIWNGISMIPATLIRKNVDFKKLVYPSVIPGAIASIISIGMAFTEFGVWSLVAKTMIASILSMVWIWIISPFRPSLKFNKYIAKELMGYGKFIIGSSIVLVTLYNIDKFYVGTIVGISALGIYELAIRIANLPVSDLSHLIGGVMFPVLSRMNNEMDRFRETFLQTLKYSSMITIPLAIGISIYGPSLIDYIYGDKWILMAIPLRILSIYALFRSMSTIIHDGFKALGHPNLLQRFVSIRLAIIGVLGIPILLKFGLTGMSYLLTMTYFIVFIFELKVISNLISINVFKIIKPIGIWIGISLFLILGAYWGGGFFPKLNKINHLVIEIGVVIIAYVIFIFYFNKPLILGLRKTLMNNTK